ncbi:hypothetical protein SPRG_22338 [Saprolegnia parasitica CBS 223.65]|uniref:Uncharacterized protein n=1 Tax=Saprolegnia parasitica (strain CBS 223.65) TaxID=695850 RepID=A0A067C2B1_SAPPC|nr:hypothetical protein SPRG_22338 [Saprolegnia parasitica CBS 223.65]KDO20952.1 hypothetical protein SPRG_22338 [Saprolegnia parasitica CBS 223.65]|eukprot:XP_012208366.1 hypothetical protein SPRG_22338 [Saprolegnia parasitica CBS 223.65]
MKGRRSTPRSTINAYDVRLKQLILDSKQATNPLFGKEQRVKGCLALADDVANDVGLYGPLLRALRSAIFSDEATARHFADAGVFADTGTVDEMQARATLREVPCFLLLDLAYRERTRVQVAEREVATSEAQLQQQKRSLFEREREYRCQLDDAFGELLESKSDASSAREAYNNLSEESRQHQHDTKATLFAMQRELHAMNTAIAGYQAEIRDLRAVREKADAMRQQFDAIDGPSQRGHATCTSPAVRDLDQALRTELQLLLLRNARIAEYDLAVRFCNDETQRALRHSFLNDICSVLDELAAVEAHIAQASPVESQSLEPSLAALLAPPQLATDSVLWTPRRLPKQAHRLNVDELERFLGLVWARVAQAERACDKLLAEYETTHKRAALLAIEAEPIWTLPQVVWSLLRDRYGDERVAMLAFFALLQAVDQFSPESPQIELFGCAFGGTVDQSAWWYLMRLKAQCAAAEVEISDDKSLRLVGQHLLRLDPSTAIQDHACDGFVANVRMNTKGVLSTRSFFDWLAKRISMADDFHFKRAAVQLARKTDTSTVAASVLTNHILESVRLARTMVGRFLRFTALDTECYDCSSVDAREPPSVSLERAVYMLSYVQLKYYQSSS